MLPWLAARGLWSTSPEYPCALCRFQEAWLNYIALQDLDYSQAYRCKCASDRCMYIIADGILLGVQRKKVWV